MTILLVLTSLILISIAVWQLTKILELSKPADYDDSEIASDKDNDMQGKLMFLFLIFIYALTIFSFYQWGDVMLPESASVHGENYDNLLWFSFAVIFFVLTSLATFVGFVDPQSVFATIPPQVYLPALNIIAALKVTIGSWSILRIFILSRGLM